MGEKLYLAMLHKIGLGHKKLHLAFKSNINYKEFYEKLSFNNLKLLGFNSKQIEYILENKEKYKLSNLEKKLNYRDVKIITINDKLYPDLLKQIHNVPFLFYLRGTIDNSPKLAVVGARKITSYGKNSIEKIVGNVSNYFTIVSGGAAGCDTAGHISALNAGNKTISIIGTGIDIDYPTGNRKLYYDIVKSGGGIISIFPVGEVGNPYNFPVRNEIVAGLSVGVLIIEAQKKSGTLITSNLALDLGKDLFAIPGDINKANSVGCNMLIRRGMAKLVTSSDDILVEYNIGNSGISKNDKKIKFADKIEEEIYNILILESKTIDELIYEIGLDIATINFKLSMMEINNLIKKGLGGKYEVF
ncbi:MAG: DNA-processing protein DprA [Candidatus Gracilibacteria bacterium]